MTLLTPPSIHSLVTTHSKIIKKKINMPTNTKHHDKPHVSCLVDKALPPAPPLDSLIESSITKVMVLDFDGVLNPLSAGTLGKKHFPTDRMAVVGNPHHVNNPSEEPPSYIVQWSTGLVGELNGILSGSDAVVVWLTTWKQHAGTLAAMMGLAPSIPQFFLDFGAPGVAHPPQGDKKPALESWLDASSLLAGKPPQSGAGVKLVWVDDDVLQGSYAGVVKHKYDGCLLTIAPNSMKGLSVYQMGMLGRFMGCGQDSV